MRLRRRSLCVALLCVSLAIVTAGGAGADEPRAPFDGDTGIAVRCAIESASIGRSESTCRLHSVASYDRAAEIVSTEPAARVRSTDAKILELLDEGVKRSATFRALVGALDESDGIVYVEFGYCAFGHLNGCLLPFIGASHGNRYLRILVTADKNRRSRDQLLALMAHELRHALEVVADHDVVDLATMQAMYKRIGAPIAGGMTGYETSAARAAGAAVLSELLATPTRR